MLVFFLHLGFSKENFDLTDSNEISLIDIRYLRQQKKITSLKANTPWSSGSEEI